MRGGDATLRGGVAGGSLGQCDVGCVLARRRSRSGEGAGGGSGAEGRRSRRRQRPARALLAWALATALAPAAAPAGASGAVPPARGPEPRATLTVATSGDYAPFSVTQPDGRLEGFDLTLARAYARDRGLELRLVRLSWPDLLEDLAAGRFDVAMSGITVRPERSLAGVFTVPVMETGAVVLVRAGAAVATTTDLDAAGVRIVVNAGGHLERVARARFPRAEVRAVAPNDAVPDLVAAGQADAAVTDTAEAPHWMRRVPELRRLPPLTHDLKAFLAPADRAARAADLDAWLLAREADGTLARLRHETLGGEPSPPTAAVLPALLAAMDERLDLMPLVAEAKRATGIGLRDPAQEERVVEAGWRATRQAARRLGRTSPAELEVRALFQAQIAAAREVQRAVLAAPPLQPGEPAADLAALREALARIGDRIARLLVQLPSELDAVSVREAVRLRLDAPGLAAPARDRIADALIAVARRGPAQPRAGASAPGGG